MDRSQPKVRSFDISKRLVFEAWEKVQANKGAPGVDAVSITKFKADETNALYKVWSRMSAGSYMPGPVRAVEIPKDHGAGVRVLGVPNVVDRIAQTAVAALLEVKLELIFHPDSYGYVCRESGGGEPKECCTRDGGRSGRSAPWPSGISSAREGSQTTARGVRQERGSLALQEKAGEPLSGMHHGVERKQTFRRRVEKLKTTSEPGSIANPGISPAGSSRSWPGGVRRRGGKNVVWALVRNSGTSRAVAPLVTTGGTGVRRGRKPKARVPDAVHWGGSGRSSDEGAVMALERRP